MRYWRHFLTDYIMAKSSQTYADATCMRGQKRLLKKAMGLSFWDRTAPMAMFDASVVTLNGSVKSGNVSVMSWVIAVLSWRKDVSAAVVHKKVGWRRISVRLAAMEA